MNLDTFIKLLSVTDGRDKIYKAAGSIAKFLEYTALKGGDKDGAKRFGALAKSVGEGRSLLRMGKWVQNTKKLTETAVEGQVFQTSETGMEYARVAADFGYIFGDNVHYLAKYGLISGADTKWVSKQSKLFQFYSYVLGVVLAAIKLVKARASGKPAAIKAATINLAKNVADILASVDAVGYGTYVGYNPSQGFVAICGFVSGALATYQNVEKLSK